MVFVHPSWFEGTVIWVMYFIPLFVCVGLSVFCILKAFISSKDEEKWMTRGIICLVLMFLCVFVCDGVGGYLWHETYEVPSVTTKVITVDEWQVKPNTVHTENGMMVVDNADQLMLITTEGEGFYNDENFLFQKFETRDILNTLKPGSVCEITYYGWREGFNSGFPNILSAKVIDDSNATNVSVSDYFGTKLSIK